MTEGRLSLSVAINEGRLAEFVAQEEARGVGAASKRDFEKAVKLLTAPPRSTDRTSRSASRGGSGDK